MHLVRECYYLVGIFRRNALSELYIFRGKAAPFVHPPVESVNRRDRPPAKRMRNYERHARTYRMIMHDIVAAAERAERRGERIDHGIQALPTKCKRADNIHPLDTITVVAALSAAVIDRNVLAARGKPRGKLIYNDLDPAGAAGKILVAYHSYFHSAASFKGDFSITFKSRRTARYGHPDTYTPELGYA